MTRYARNAFRFSLLVVLIAGLVLLSRTEVIHENFDWLLATSRGTAKSYREYVGKWRKGKHAPVALLEWEKALGREYQQVEWRSPQSVSIFMKNHPEFREDDIRKAQYEAVMKDGSYDVLNRLRGTLPPGNERDEIEARIDSLVRSKVKLAIENDDFMELQRLSKEYSDWPRCQKEILARIPMARDNSAKAEWGCLADSISEHELRQFINKYSGTTYAKLAAKRIETLCDDFNYVKSKGTLKAYLDFADNHPDSPDVDEAWQHVADELAAYVFKRKALGSDKSLVISTLARYKKARPFSGGLYGTGGYYTSPLRITIPLQDGLDYFVKLVDRSTGQTAGVYVRAGTTTEVEIPDGTYSVRYVAGSQWYGVRFLFGLDAQYSKADRNFTFSNGQGYTLTLQKIVNGNLHMSPISAGEF